MDNVTPTTDESTLSLEITGNVEPILKTVDFGLDDERISILITMDKLGNISIVTDAPLVASSAEDIAEFGAVLKNIGTVVESNADAITES